jgi:ubiquinone/menaquinone biosynthesis C-methylase UbiE
VPFRLLFGRKAEYFFTFKDRATNAAAEDVHEIYAATADVHIKRDTDLNEACLGAIHANVVGATVLDVGCGRGHLAGQLCEAGFDVTGSDIRISDELRRRFSTIRFEQTRAETLPFPDAGFDTVICTHTLEHVQDLTAAIKELRRVARRRLIVVVPRQRPYKYTFDLHLHFFPYEHSLLAHFPPTPGIGARTLRDLDGDWYYQEDTRV